ncbi:hypothetical protein BJ742DRAFT_787118 [Cladochytrium replicatum]|nr:hypothetical protein BJ742DRAFT_787118 [Cladochytrium replicatum]
MSLTTSSSRKRPPFRSPLSVAKSQPFISPIHTTSKNPPETVKLSCPDSPAPQTLNPPPNHLTSTPTRSTSSSQRRAFRTPKRLGASQARPSELNSSAKRRKLVQQHPELESLGEERAKVERELTDTEDRLRKLRVLVSHKNNQKQDLEKITRKWQSVSQEAVRQLQDAIGVVRHTGEGGSESRSRPNAIVEQVEQVAFHSFQLSDILLNGRHELFQALYRRSGDSNDGGEESTERKMRMGEICRSLGLDIQRLGSYCEEDDDWL